MAESRMFPAVREEPLAGRIAPLKADAGDVLVIDPDGQSGLPRIGQIIAVLGQDGAPPYRVHWVVGDYESLISPVAGAYVRKSRQRAAF